jgi:hypothetical protein
VLAGSVGVLARRSSRSAALASVLPGLAIIGARYALAVGRDVAGPEGDPVLLVSGALGGLIAFLTCQGSAAALVTLIVHAAAAGTASNGRRS